MVFVNQLIKQQIEWANYVLQMKGSEETIDERDVIQFIAVMMWSHLTNMSFKATMSILSNLGQAVPYMTTLERVQENMCSFHPSHRIEEVDTVWHARRDQTQYVGKFEHVSFSTGKRLLYVPATVCDFRR